MPKNYDSNRLEVLVRELALPGGRMVGTSGHDMAGEYVLAQLGSLDLDPYLQDGLELPYERNGQRFANYVGVIPGLNRSLPPLLIGAHYDSVIPHPCADDNAAAVAIVLHASARLSKRERERDIVIAIFDAEEPPYFQTEAMGSVRFCEDQADKRGFHAALILDLVGHDVTLPQLRSLTPARMRNLLFVQGAESHPALATLVENFSPPKSLGLIAALNEYMPDMSDHYAFRQRGVPYLFFSCGQWEHYHQSSDTPDKLNYRKMARITEALITLAEGVATADLAAPVPPRDFTVAMEVAMIKRALGPWLSLTGFNKMKGRRDLSAFAGQLISTMGTMP